MLSEYSAEFFARSPVLAWPIFALGLFLVVFIAVSLRALLRDREQLQRMAELPLCDETEGGSHD